MTNKEISELSDFGLNKAIAELRINEFETKYLWIKYGRRGYCHDMNALMPLIFEHEISIDYFDEGLSAIHSYSHVINKNPARALAECLLMVLIEKENNNG